MEPTTFVLFGATGDLAKRKIYPALYNLFVRGKLPSAFSVIGLGRREWTDETLRANVEQSLRRFSRTKPDDEAALGRFLRAFRYCVLDIGREADYQRLLKLVKEREAELGIPENRLFYLSVGPEHFGPIADNIRSSGLGSGRGWKRLVIEKPFGHDLASARELNRKLGESFAEHEIYRIDHYLGKPVVQRLEALGRHPAVRGLWTGRRPANVQIVADESVGVEERAGYYDKSGALRDMFQNHLLQLLMMTAVHLPGGGSGDVHQRKKRIMEALRPVTKETAAACIVRGQYAEGFIGGSPVVGYTAEPGIAPDSQTDTFIAARLEIDNDDWRGVPFYIRTGKRLREKSTRIVVEFGAPEGQPEHGSDLLVIEIGPNERVTLQRGVQFAGSAEGIEQVSVELDINGDNSPEAYENLIGDALAGDPTFFAHWDEVELSWRWVQPVLDAFAENRVPLHRYAAGGFGPAESDALPAKDGFRWWLDDRSDAKSDKSEGERYVCQSNG
ncbi:MAG: glucose-6-phosphate dehydrogenase [Thermobacillus sp. ZCTH02-B1]|uniref:glucose-6-phosphate dehydrogenase n=1 Tax=Thermobacillus sp. ZCTH02-B1 TaxID=1858795 RepID=UPI000B574277|nr:glucose-6-phosphate dehydrogenase [Thermobacillus sp. ZCTH02-B1]OUM95637.1 MAG: glucose-6-phosphate dehydrogenase [Thermobacillus sp. ZCTH02-B1]